MNAPNGLTPVTSPRAGSYPRVGAGGSEAGAKAGAAKPPSYVKAISASELEAGAFAATGGASESSSSAAANPTAAAGAAGAAAAAADPAAAEARGKMLINMLSSGTAPVVGGGGEGGAAGRDLAKCVG